MKAIATILLMTGIAPGMSALERPTVPAAVTLPPLPDAHGFAGMFAGIGLVVALRMAETLRRPPVSTVPAQATCVEPNELDTLGSLHVMQACAAAKVRRVPRLRAMVRRPVSCSCADWVATG